MAEIGKLRFNIPSGRWRIVYGHGVGVFFDELTAGTVVSIYSGAWYTTRVEYVNGKYYLIDPDVPLIDGLEARLVK